MIAHGHIDVRYKHHGRDIHPTDSNYTVGSFAQLLKDLESPPESSCKDLFLGGIDSFLGMAVLDRADICLHLLGLLLAVPNPTKSLPLGLQMQFDTATSDNKN